MFSPTGGFLGSVGGPGMFDDPTSISVDSFRGLIYTVDYGSNNVKVKLDYARACKTCKICE